MAEYFYGAATMGTVFVMAQIINQHIPNDLFYYVNLVLPF